LTLKADIYSFGILIWEVFTEKYPYENSKMDENDLAQLILTENLNPLTEKDENGEIKKIEYISGMPIEIEELVNKCILRDPKERPTIEEVIDILISLQEKYNLNYSTK
jgi:mitogen-activated protein kinase kinase